MSILYHQLGIMYILMIVGFVLHKVRFLQEKDVMSMSTYAINIAMTAAVLSGMNIAYSADKAKTVVLIMLFQIVIQFLIYICVIYVSNKIIKQKAHTKIYLFALLYCNAAMVGAPIVTAMFGEDAAFIASLHIIAMNISMYSVGFAIIKEKDTLRGKVDLANILTPSFLIMLLGLVLFLCRITYPTVLGDAVKVVGNTCMPVAMIVTGAMLAEYELKNVFTDVRAYIISFFRLLVIPFLVFLILKYVLHIDENVIIYAEIIMFACPSPSGLGPFVKIYGGDYELAVHIVAISAIFSSITMPVLMSVVHI